MRTASRALTLCLASIALSASAAPLRVFTCEPEWAALVRTLAPDAVIGSATHALQDPHHIEARPALIGLLRTADLAVCTGASLEAGWLPMLQQRASNPAVQTGQPGMFFAAEQVRLIGIPERVDRSDGDVHTEGNPHLHLDPHRLQQVAASLSERLARLDPAGAASYRADISIGHYVGSSRLQSGRTARLPCVVSPSWPSTVALPICGIGWGCTSRQTWNPDQAYRQAWVTCNKC